jgi:hypothetical protein
MAQRRHRDLGMPDSILPPHKPNPAHEPHKYVVLPADLHEALAAAAQDRGYRTREFIVEILRRAMNLHD